VRRFNDRIGRVSALLALVAAMATSVATVWHAGDDDLACIPAAISSSDGAARTIGTAPPPGGDPRHCVLCHWTRWCRSLPSNRSQIIAPAQSAIGFVVAPLAAGRHQACGLTPGRAPPA
jgi:hypothetical protein